MGKDNKKNSKHNKSSSNSNQNASNKTNYSNYSNIGHHGTSVIFNSGSPISFAIAKSKIVNAFIAEDCFDYIDYDITNNTIAEESFDDPEPDRNAMVTTQLTNNINSINAHYNAIDAATQAAAGTLLPATLNSMTVNNNLKRLDALHTANMNAHQLEKIYNDALSTWKKNKKEHRQKQANCMKVFNKVFGGTTLSLVRENLNRQRYRAAWKQIIDKNALAIGGQANVTAIMHQLTTATYNPKTSLTGHLNMFNVLFEQIEAFGEQPISDNMRLGYILESFSRNNDHQYKKVIDYIKMSSMDYPTSLVQLYKRESELFTTHKTQNNSNNNRTTNNNNNKSNNTNNSDNDAQALIAKSSNSSNSSSNDNNKTNRYCNKCKRHGHTDNYCRSHLQCTKCNKSGHTDENCYTVIPCNKCGKVGHNLKYCPNENCS